jgi:hypothetical protein
MADAASRMNEASARTERTLEEELQKVVGSESFARLLAQAMGTTMGVTKLWSDGMELGMRSLRMPTQGELTRIAGQIARLEDKLEDVLIAVERLEDTVARLEPKPAPARRQAAARKPREAT